jgi:hypothetical protein
MAAMPSVSESVRANRGFLRRAVRWLAAERGIRQFLDIGTGLPAADNTHEVAQRAAPDAKVVYVDYDPVVLLNAQALLTSTIEGRTDDLQGDVREPEDILARADKALDLTEPVALMLVAVLHAIPDGEDPFAIVRTLSAALPAGSFLVLSHAGLPGEVGGTGGPPSAEAMAGLAKLAAAAPEAVIPRPHAEIVQFFGGWDLLEPGVVPASKWRADEPEATVIWAGVGEKMA